MTEGCSLSPMEEADLHALLSRLLLAGRLPGGVKLREHRLAAIFGVSRERVRKVLHRLGHERLLMLVKNRGAFTIKPDLREGHLVYEARRILEAGIAAHLADHLTDDQVARLRAHVDSEADALRRDDRATWQRLSAEFHYVLAAMTGNPIVERQARELVGRTIMLVTHYETSVGSACGCEEHRAIFRALAAGERAKAVKAMSQHLSLVETRLRPLIAAEEAPSVDDILIEEVAAWRRAREGTDTAPASMRA
jgi:DNA-binding GntR family transcriptional regulator